ncbi:hypothetical protein L6452_17994 [Arctium lappa]|uniref:Uncharacterized protein n=1 Tax=Arctium lappa TaxID=4217 RepID=A0ACB9C4Z3_ARCLA|nr:hypothetical protein L6452_17994 [Arctium lappa]
MARLWQSLSYRVVVTVITVNDRGVCMDLFKNSWKLESVPRPHLLYEALLVAGKSHDIGPISCPEQLDIPEELSGVTFGRQKKKELVAYLRRGLLDLLCPQSVPPQLRVRNEESTVDGQAKAFVEGERKQTRLKEEKGNTLLSSTTIRTTSTIHLTLSEERVPTIIPLCGRKSVFPLDKTQCRP